MLAARPYYVLRRDARGRLVRVLVRPSVRRPPPPASAPFTSPPPPPLTTPFGLPITLNAVAKGFAEKGPPPGVVVRAPPEQYPTLPWGVWPDDQGIWPAEGLYQDPQYPGTLTRITHTFTDGRVTGINSYRFAP